MPAATGAALVISTPGALKFIRPAQELDCCAHPHGANANVDQNTVHGNFERIAPCFLAPIIARGTDLISALRRCGLRKDGVGGQVRNLRSPCLIDRFIGKRGQHSFRPFREAFLKFRVSEDI